MEQFVHIPESLEALLVAEKARVEAELDAGRALQCRGFPAFGVIANSLRSVELEFFLSLLLILLSAFHIY
jgi:hypothetical protein